MKHWTLDDIQWELFDSSKVDPETLKIIKAASLVEFNSSDYATYLKNIFPSDKAFCKAVDQWAKEEIQHGEVLAKWAKVADPNFDFDKSLKKFKDGYSLDLETDESIRGSRCGELISRCVVEIGTSSYYSAIKDSTQEPVLQQICQKIASDEFRHYKLFYDFMKHYIDVDELNLFKRLKVAIGRIRESEDDELAYAYYAANANENEKYDHEKFMASYLYRAYNFYRPHHFQRIVSMGFKAIGLKANDRVSNFTANTYYKFMQFRLKQYAKKAA